jgi:hypothetical protein
VTAVFSSKAGCGLQASGLIGESMCYSILEWLKEELPEFYSMRAASAPEVSSRFRIRAAFLSSEYMLKSLFLL